MTLLPEEQEHDDGVKDALDDEDISENVEAVRASLSALAENILQRSARLLDELQQFEDLRVALWKERIAGTSGLVSVIKREHKAAQQVLQGLSSPDADAKKLARIKYSNLPAQERDWNVIKRCRWLRCIGQSFLIPAPDTATKSASKGGRRGAKDKEDIVFLDASIDGGAEWLRIVNIEQKRLLYEMADSGWDWGADEEESGNESNDAGSNAEVDEEDDISLVRIIRNMVRLSRTTSFRYQHPRIHILLTRLEEGPNHEIDRLLRKLRAMGGEDVEVIVDCANSDYNKAPVPPLETALSNLLNEDLGSLTPTVVIDTSILIALASDLSHCNVEVQDWHRSDLRAQIQEESEGRSFLLSNAYPVLRSRKLVCTKLAARHYMEIVSTIGTETERARAEILLSSDPNADESETHDALTKFQKLSIHPVPPDLRLPITILSEDAEADPQAAIKAGELSPVALDVQRELLDLASNRATFMYGWLSGNAVITSNNNLTKQIVRLIEANGVLGKGVGPNIWVFSFNRALSTKGKPHDFDMANSRRRERDKRPKQPVK